MHKVLPTALLCTTKLAQSTPQYSFVLKSLHKARPSTTLYYKARKKDFPVLLLTTLCYKACTKYFPVLLCTTRLAESTSKYYFVPQSLHKVLPSTIYYFVPQGLHKARPSTTLNYKACTKYSPLLLCTIKLARSTSQYYFVLQSLHKVLPSTTVHYKARTKHFPVLLCTTKLAKRTSQFYLVVQSLYKARPHTTLHYKACTKHSPVLLCTVKLAQSTSQYYFAQPLQCVEQHHVANPHLLRTWQQNMTTIMQPLHCDLRPEIQQANRPTHTGTTTRCRTQRRNPLRPERPQPQPPHSRGTLHCRLQPLCREKHTVSCSGFHPNTSPMQCSCSNYIAFCSSIVM